MGANPFEYDLKYVCDVLNIAYQRGRDGKHYIPCGQCPRCASCNKKPTRLKLCLDFEKNAWNCPVQPEVGGGVLHLYVLYQGGDTKSAKSELDKLYRGESVEIRKAVAYARKKSEEALKKQIQVAPLEKRDEAYQKLLSRLVLSDSHLQNLKERGLDERIIPILGYKSATRMEISFDENLKGIPGFYLNTEERYAFSRRRTGILVPVRNLYYQICGFQIRQDRLPSDDDNFAKYVWLQSGNRKGGCSASGTENVHFTGFWQGCDIRRVCLTEGVLKADIASYLSGMPFLGLTGVANTSQLPKALKLLKSLGTQVIYACPDMDRFNNPAVMKATETWMRMIQEAGLTHDPVKNCQVSEPVIWQRYVDGVDLKGVDDLLWLKKQRTLNQGET